jgi:hypothetical protein
MAPFQLINTILKTRLKHALNSTNNSHRRTNIWLETIPFENTIWKVFLNRNYTSSQKYKSFLFIQPYIFFNEAGILRSQISRRLEIINLWIMMVKYTFLGRLILKHVVRQESLLNLLQNSYLYIILRSIYWIKHNQ